MQVAQANPEVHARLYFLSRSEPALGVCMGTVAVQPIPSSGATVFELRDGDSVVGRVRLNPVSPATIPAPTNLSEVPEPNPKGHLSAKFTWEIPAGLARVSPLTYGFHLYRIDKDYAELIDAHTTPPTPKQIVELVETKPTVERVNDLPILPGNPGAAFVLDNNRAYEEGGGPAFEDGDQFYYFAAAADLLGRPGNLSPGILVTICDRMPPAAPDQGAGREPLRSGRRAKQPAAEGQLGGAAGSRPRSPDRIPPLPLGRHQLEPPHR